MAEGVAPRATAAPEWLYRLSLLLLFVAPGQFAYAVDPKHGPFIAVADVVAVLVVGVWLLWALSSGAWRSLIWAPRHVWGLVAVAVFSGLGAGSLKEAALEIIQLLLYFVAVYMLFINLLTDDRRRRTAVRVLLAATSAVVLYGLVQYCTAADPVAVKASFGSRGALSGFLTIILPLFLGLALWSEVTWERWWAAAVLVLGALLILLPPLVLVLAAVLLATAVGWARGTRRLATVGSCVLFLFVTITLAPLNGRVHREMLDPYEEGPVFKTMAIEADGRAVDGPQAAAGPPPVVKKRWIEWVPAVTMIAQNPLTGVGTGNYQLNIGQPEYYGFLPNVKKSEPDTNNLYLVVGSSMGFLGLVCLLAYMGHFWQHAGRLWQYGQSPWGRALTCGLWGVTLAVPLANLFTSTFVRGTALVWVFAYALIGSLAHTAVEAQKGEDA